MKKIRDEAMTALGKAQKNMKKYYDAKHKNAPVFKIGDKVYVEAKEIKTDRPTKKFDDKRLGPYEILEKIRASSYKLRLPETDQSHPVFNESKLTLYHAPPEGRGEKHPPPRIIGGEPEYEAEEILKHRKKGWGYQYLIKWKDYSMSERTWEPRHHLTHMKKMLNKYNREHGISVRKLSSEEDIQIGPGVLPILPSGHWDYLIQQYKPKEESFQYSMKKLFIPEINDFIPVDGDVDPGEGVMSRFERFSILS
jgi:hypothetical protein